MDLQRIFKKLNFFSRASPNLPELHEIHGAALMYWMITQVIVFLDHSACNLQARIQREYALLRSWK